MRPQRSLILVALLFVIVSIVTLLPRIQNNPSGVKEFIENELTKEEIEGFFVDQDPTYVPLPSLELLWQPPMRNVRLRRGYTLWGTDCHMGPRAEFKSLFPKMGMNYIDRGIQTGYNLPQFYDRNNPPAWNVNLWKQIQKEFFEQHKDEEEFKKADGFMCSFDPHYCFLYLPFNKPIITAFAYRIEGHIMGPSEDAKAFLEIVKEMDRHPEVVLGATNPYDAMYINHYTGSRRAVDLTSLGDYMPHRYDPKGGLPIIIGPQRLSHGGNIIAESIQRASEGKAETFRTVNQLYSGGYTYETLCKHKAVVVLPYSIHSYGMLEMRKMNIPLIYPSPKLLATYEKDLHMIAERKTNLGQTSDGALVGHPRSLSGSFNPNNDFSLPDLEHWLKFSDFYQWPVLTFDNITHLFHIAETVDFEAQSRKIAAFNKKLEQKVVKKWESVFYNVFGDIPPGERPIPSSYEEGMRIWKEKTQKPSWNFLPSKSASEGIHENWIVVTSINGPTDQVKTLAALPEWKVVVVGDKKTPKDWSWPNCIFLSVDQQKELGYRIFDLLPFDHYTRKNVGYLYAIQHGAKVIYDTDDDNVIAQKGIVSYPETTDELPLLQTKYHLLNPYGFFGKPTLWPRGFPLEEVRNRNVIPTNFTYEEVKIPIQQGLADYDPDVDAIHRLTNPLPAFFKNRPGAVYPKGVFSPFNSQNTLFHYSAFWGLLIPKTTTFRVCDIWRGYWAQRILWEIGSNLCFLNATAVQVRNPHNYLDDFEDELDLYLSGGRLVKYLKQWVPEATENLFDMIYQLHQDLAAGGFWERREAELTKAWLSDLIDVGYKMPPLQSS